MKGSVKKDGKTWYYIVDAGRKPNGQRLQKKKRGFATKKEAQAALNELLSQLNKGIYIEPSNMLFSELANMWLEQKRYEVRYSTFKTYHQVINTHILPQFESVQISRITHDDVNYFV